MIDPEIGFTSDVIRDPARFVGRTQLVRDCITALNSKLGLIAVYGKRGVGKSSLLRQIQQMALGDYHLAKVAGLTRDIPARPRRYLTVYYTCDSLISGGEQLISRLCNDQDPEDGLMRLVPDDGKEVVEFTRSKEASAGSDLKVVQWGAKGIETSKYARVVPGDIIQTFRNFIQAILTHPVRNTRRDGILILLDEFDVMQDKSGLGSLIKSMSSEAVKFGICGVANDLSDLVADHASVERLLESGSLHVKPMPPEEARQIITTAQQLFRGSISFDDDVIEAIVSYSEGFPYLVQLFGKACVEAANRHDTSRVTQKLFDEVLAAVQSGEAFPTLESAYQRAIGDSAERQILLHLLAEQPEDRTFFNDDVGRVVLKRIRPDAKAFEIQYIDQLLPRLIERKYGPVLVRIEERPGVYEFANPVFRVYAKLRHF